MVILSQGEIERGAVMGFGFGPDFAAVPLDNAMNNGQPHAGPLKLIGPVQALEHAKEFAGESRADCASAVTT
jgi:hypothetical protein